MTITEHVRNDVVVLEIEGRMTIEGRDSELSSLVKERLASGHRAFLLDLNAVPYSDTGGLSELVVSLKNADRAEGSLRLVRVRPYVRKLLDTAGLSHLFQIHESVDDGIKSFDS